MLLKILIACALSEICAANLVTTFVKGDMKHKLSDNLTVNEGEEFEVVCAKSDSNDGNFSWSRAIRVRNEINNVPLKTVSPSTLNFTSVSTYDQGKYVCEDENGEIKTLNIRVTSVGSGFAQSVNKKKKFSSFKAGSKMETPVNEVRPYIVIMQKTKDGDVVTPTTLTVREGDNVTLICAVKTGQTVDYDIEWNIIKTTKEEPYADNVQMRKSSNGIDQPKLIITSITFDNSGRYVCFTKDNQLFVTVFIQVKPNFGIKIGLSNPLEKPTKKECDTSLSDQHYKDMEEIRKGLHKTAEIIQYLLKKLPNAIPVV